MRSRLLALLFSFLLLGMHQGAQLHALAHLGSGLDRPHEQALQPPPDDTPCATCALLAGGSNAIAAAETGAEDFATIFAAPRAATPSRAASAPTYYLSRAPPTLL
jgi:hypothetical protein